MFVKYTQVIHNKFVVLRVIIILFHTSLEILIKWHFPVVLYIILFKVILSFESADKILKCNH